MHRLTCQALSAEISERQCVINQAEAGRRRRLGKWAVGWLTPCMDCATGREVLRRQPQAARPEVESCCVDGVVFRFRNFFSVQEAMTYLGCSRATIYRLIRRGVLPKIKGRPGILREALETCLSNPTSANSVSKADTLPSLPAALEQPSLRRYHGPRHHAKGLPARTSAPQRSRRMEKGERLIRPSEVARQLAVSRSTVYRWYWEGVLKGVKLNGGTIRILESAVQEKLAQAG